MSVPDPPRVTPGASEAPTATSNVERGGHVEPEGSILTESVNTRFPDLKDLGPREKIARLEDYMVEGAQVEADLARLRLSAHRQLQVAEEEWASIQGWQAQLQRPGRQDATAADRDRAKATVRPDLWATIRECRFLIPRLNEEIARMERDTKRASRIYSFIVGA